MGTSSTILPTSSLQPPPPYKNNTMKLIFITITLASIAAIGWSTRVSIPVGVTTNPALEELETFYHDLHPQPTPPPYYTVPSMKEMRKKKEKKVAARKAREDWEALTASLREQMLVTENTENAPEEIQNENKTEIEIYEVQGVETKEREEKQEEMKKNDWVKEILYTQLEVTHMESSKRGLLIWAMQMEYAGQTFFDGYVLFSLFSDCVSLLQHRCFRVSGKRF